MQDSSPRLDLPDAHHLEKLRRALWSGQVHGRVAALVGAGMSANAESLDPSLAPMSMFAELAQRMWAELNNATTEKAPHISDPIAVASDYEGIFGTHALDELLRSELADAMRRPTRIHRLLMSLPWVDVYTTNYDTILERAASEVVDRNYTVVPTREALVGTQQPRIIKLHGSFPDHRPFIITKEQYRQYPRSHAAFVNTVQQAVMEHSLCLLGFGGTDPNFLAWAGWVHDNLGSAAPPIYLIGVLDLDTRYRTILERRRVVPIDLGPLFPRKQFPDAPSRHRLANEWFLLNLAHGEPDPMQWPFEGRRRASVLAEFPLPRTPLLHVDSSEANLSPLENLARTLKRFPGWLASPERRRLELEHLLSGHEDDLKDAISSDKPQVARQAWTMIATLMALLGRPLDHEDRQSLNDVLERSHDDSDQWFQLALSLMASLRWAGYWAEHDRWRARLEKRTDLRDEQRAQLGRELALRALDQLDYVALKEALSAWPSLSGAFHLELVRAALLVEVSDFERAARIARNVLIAVRSGLPTYGGAIKTLAIEGVAMTFLMIASLQIDESASVPTPYGRMEELTRWDCNPWKYFEEAKNRLREPPKKHFQVRKSFDVGRFRTTRSGIPGSTPEDVYRKNAFSALHLFEAFGLPFRCGNSCFFNDLAVTAAKITAVTNPERAFSVFLRARDDKAVDETCTHLYVARLSQEHVTSLYALAFRVVHARMTATRKPVEEDDHQLAAALELLSRLARRTDPKQLDGIFTTALTLAQAVNFQHRFVLARATLHCITRAFVASTETVQIEWTGQLLKIPLVLLSSMAARTQSWLDPLLSLNLPTVSDLKRADWKYFIDSLLADVRHPNPEQRVASLVRLVQLHRTRNLDRAQSQRFGEALWEQLDGAGLPLGFVHFFYPSLLLELPGVPSPSFAKELRRLLLGSVFSSTEGHPGSERNAAEEAAARGFRRLSVFLSHEHERLSEDEARRVIKRAVDWLKEHQSREHHGQFRDPFEVYEDGLMGAFVEFLDLHVLSELSPVEPTQSALVRTLLDMLAAEPVSISRWAFELQRLAILEREQAARQLLTGVRSPNDAEVISAVLGVLRWCRQDKEAPKAAFREVLDSIQYPGRRVFSPVLHELASFVDERFDVLDPSDIERLVRTAVLLFTETSLLDSASDSLYDDPECKLDARVAAAHLAAVLWRHSEQHRSQLEVWQAVTVDASTPEVRETWTAVFRQSSNNA